MCGGFETPVFDIEIKVQQFGDTLMGWFPFAEDPQARGKVLQAKTQISPDIGFMGLFLDSEGNRIALHSRK